MQPFALPRNPEDLRAYPRASMRTCLTVFCDGPNAPSVYKAWTEDVSACGVQFACDQEIADSRVWVRLLLPGLEGKLVECQLVRRGNRQSETLLRRTGPRFCYGAKFERVLDELETQELMATFPSSENVPGKDMALVG